MLTSSLVWRMALSHLRKQWKQTLITIMAGAIGAMLIAISAVNYESVERSGAAWIEKHLGPINWKLTPEKVNSEGFSAQEAAFLVDFSRKSDYTILPYVKAEAAVFAEDTDTGEQSILKNMLFMGFSMEEAARFDPAFEDLWTNGLTDDELIINRDIALLLHVEIGDMLKVSVSGKDKLFRIRGIVEQRGLTGYQEYGAFAGTIIGTEQAVRQMSGQAGDGYEAILAGSTDPSVNLGGMFFVSGQTYNVENLKSKYKNEVDDMNYSIIIGMISIVAVISSLLFMRQVLVMIGDSRREMYGILRAIGFSRDNISAMFMVEALLLSVASALLGTLIGLSGGYSLIQFFYSFYAADLSQMAGLVVPITAHVSILTAAAVFAATLLFLLFISGLTARKASRFNIVEALRGPSADGGTLRAKGWKRTRNRWVIAAGLSATCVHFIFAFIDPPELSNDNMLTIVLTWIASVFTVLFIALNGVGKMAVPLQKLLRFIGVPPISMLLAVKYPNQHKGRTYTAALLFALVMMLITFLVGITQLIQASGNVDRINQTVLGFGGYAVYQSELEKDKIEAVAAADPLIQEHMRGKVVVEPYMLSMQENGIAQAIIPVTKELLLNNNFALNARSPAFSSDAEAWQAVLNDPAYVILPDYYKEKFPKPLLNLKAGDKITLPVYKSKLRSREEAWVPAQKRDFIIAGFLNNDAASGLIDFYGTTLMNKKVVDELRPLGHKWPNQTDLGFVLFQFDYKDIKLAKELEERFALEGVLAFHVPYVQNTAEQLINKQIGYGFIGFTVISALIGLLGLAIILFRAVRERSKQIGMMRCIGVPGKSIFWMLFIEGFVISLIGLLSGLAIGLSGVHMFVESVKADLKGDKSALLYEYPFDIVFPIIAGLLLASLLINITPARAALKLKAVDVLKMNSD